jgi:hypothetical protein
LFYFLHDSTQRSVPARIMRRLRSRLAVSMGSKSCRPGHAAKFLEPVNVLVLAGKEDGADGRPDIERRPAMLRSGSTWNI